MQYVGVDDGGGDYGDSVCDEWQCDTCDYEEEGDCFGGGWIPEEYEDFDPNDYNRPSIADNIPDAGDWIDREPPAYTPPARDMDDLPF